MPRIYRPARTEELAPLILTDAQAFGDATDQAHLERSASRSRLEEFRVLDLS